MRIRSNPGNIISSLLILTLPWALSCADGSYGPEDENHPPVVVSISVAGGGERIGAGSQVLLVAETSDIDGDPVTLSWSGEGIQQGTVDQENKSVEWWVPADGYGNQVVTCTVSDGQAVGSGEETFPVGRVLSSADYGDVSAGDVTWNTGGLEPPFYILQGEVTIPENLIVGPGVEVFCKNGAHLMLNGGFLAQGGSDDSEIAFRTLVPDGEWTGIRLNSSTEEFDLTSLLVYNAVVGLTVFVATEVSLTNCLLSNCGTGLEYYNASEPEALLQVTNSHFVDCGTDIGVSSCEVQLTSVSSAGTNGEGLIIGGDCRGFCSTSSFNKGGTAISLAGGSYLAFHGNSFTGQGLAFYIASGYGADPLKVDARCNYWGTNLDSEIRARIDDTTTGAARVSYSPWDDGGGTCVPSAELEIATGVEIDGDVDHPLGQGLPAGTDLEVLATDGIPRLLYVEMVGGDIHEALNYQWTLLDGEGQFLTEPGIFSSQGHSASYPGQIDDPTGSQVFFVATGPSPVTIKVTVTDSWERIDEVEEILSY